MHKFTCMSRNVCSIANVRLKVSDDPGSFIQPIPLKTAVCLHNCMVITREE